MKLKIQLALVAALFLGTPAMAAEITAEECAAIRNLGINLATANLEASKAMLAASKEIPSLILESIDNQKLQKGLVDLSKMLKTKDLDNKMLVKGLTALNKVCPA